MNASLVSTPFQRGRFEDLPERPRRPHPYFQTRVEEVPVSTSRFARMRAHVRVYGSGPPLLLVHGLMTSSYSWRYALEPLGKHYTLYMPDLPGAGRSEGPLAPAYHPEALAEWLGALQRALGIRGERVIGNSMGGYLCLRLALSDPESMSRLVNVHSPGVPEGRLYLLAGALSLPFAHRLLSRWIRSRPLRWAHANVHYWDESLKSIEEAHEYGDPLATREGVKAFIKYLEETMAPGPMREFQRTLVERRALGEAFPVPLMHLYARRDPMVPPRFGEVMAERTGAKLVWLDEGSHFAHVDAIERFLPPVLAFLGAEGDAGRIRATASAR
jgi:pimeloyl-ACP methyl ester carboxylesterase